MKIKDIEKKLNEANEKLNHAKELKNEAMALEKEYSAKAEECALAGDVDLFMEYRKKAQQQEAISYIQSKQIDSITASPMISKEESVSAWEDYAKDYSRQLKAKIEKFQASKAKLLNDYLEMVSMQEEACKIRERLASYIGKKVEPLSVDAGLNQLYPMEYIPCVGRAVDWTSGKVEMKGTSVSDADAIYYLSSLQFNNPMEVSKSHEEKRIRNVVVWHKTV